MFDGPEYDGPDADADEWLRCIAGVEPGTPIPDEWAGVLPQLVDPPPATPRPAARTAGAEAKPCPRCKRGILIERMNKKSGGRFFGCSAFPECRYTEPKP